MQVTNVQNFLEMATQKQHIVVWRRCKLVMKSIHICEKRKDTCRVKRYMCDNGRLHVQ